MKENEREMEMELFSRVSKRTMKNWNIDVAVIIRALCGSSLPVPLQGTKKQNECLDERRYCETHLTGGQFTRLLRFIV